MQRLKGGVEPVIGVVIALALAGGVSVQWLATREGTKETRAFDEVCTEYRVLLARSTKAQAAMLIYEIFADLDRLETDHPDDPTRRRAKAVRLLKKLGNQAPYAPDEGKSLEQ